LGGLTLRENAGWRRKGTLLLLLLLQGDSPVHSTITNTNPKISSWPSS
jgi:hypothetical protein